MNMFTMDWSGLWWSFLLIYGFYAPCLLTLLDREQPVRQRLLLLLPCLCLSWLGYWLSQRRLRHQPGRPLWPDLTKN